MPPQRSGGWNGNTELLAGAAQPSYGNPHLEYYRQVMARYNIQGRSLKGEDIEKQASKTDDREVSYT